MISALISIAFGCSEPDADAEMSGNRDFPSRTLTNAHVIYKDSGFIKIDLHSQLIEDTK